MSLARNLANLVQSITAQTNKDVTINGLTVGKGAGSVATNTAVGASALAANTTGASNTSVGNSSLTSNTTASYNTAVGFEAARAITTGQANTALGNRALYSTTTPDYNVGIGYFAGYYTTTGGNNTALGSLALFNNTTASNNTAVGYQAGYSQTTGGTVGQNTFLGTQAGYSNQTGYDNTYVGWKAGYLHTGSNGAFFGDYAGYNTTGDSNTFVGRAAGYNVTTGAKNTIIGSYSGNQGGLDIRTASNYIVLSDGDGNPRGVFNASGWLVASNGAGYFTQGAHILAANSNQGDRILQVITGNYSGQNCVQIYAVTSESGINAGGTAMGVSKNGGTNRSINASGTINASGADYAEYMTKAGDFIIAKGDVVGIDGDGKLTNVFADAVSFIVKSTDPSYVGGDSWGNEESVGMKRPEPPTIDATDEEKAQYETDKAAFDAALEAARQMVDRVAFAGQVPVNVTGATAGQYIIPVNDNGAIKGEAVSNPTFEQYQQAVGKVIAIEQDGRARIIVKVA